VSIKIKKLFLVLVLFFLIVGCYDPEKNKNNYEGYVACYFCGKLVPRKDAKIIQYADSVYDLEHSSCSECLEEVIICNECLEKLEKDNNIKDITNNENDNKNTYLPITPKKEEEIVEGKDGAEFPWVLVVPHLLAPKGSGFSGGGFFN
jgi:hypothetical protein